MKPGFEWSDDVTSDLSFVARGTSLGRLFEAAAEALLAATVEDPSSVRGRERRLLSLVEPDLELLLLAFLNELVYLRDVDLLLLRADRVEVFREAEPRLEATLVGEPLDADRHRMRCEVKAVTGYGLLVNEVEGAWEARVTLDV